MSDTIAVRDDEAIDLRALSAYLSKALPDLTGDLTVEQFSKGHSNLTYLLSFGTRQLVLRRPPRGAKIKTAHDMGREYRILNALWGHYPKVPRPLCYCDDQGVIGTPFYLMERVAGLILRGPRGTRDHELDPETMAALSRAAVDTLAELHAVDVTRCGLADEGHPEGYVRRQVEGWSKRYHDAQTDQVAAVDAIIPWLAEHQPRESGIALIHGDFKYDNLVLDPEHLPRIIAVLDWEMATVGDPLMDLGTTLAYWIDSDDNDVHKMLPFGPTALAGNLTRQQLVERYSEKSGRVVSDPLFYYVFGLFKIIVIAQQIYKRFQLGLTKDPRFAQMGMGVQVLAQIASRALELQRISQLA